MKRLHVYLWIFGILITAAPIFLSSVFILPNSVFTTSHHFSIHKICAATVFLWKFTVGCNPHFPKDHRAAQRIHYQQQQLQKQQKLLLKQKLQLQHQHHDGSDEDDRWRRVHVNIPHGSNADMKNPTSKSSHHLTAGTNVSSYSKFAREEMILQDFREHLISILGVTNPMPCLQRAFCSLSSAAGSHPDSTRNLVRDYLNLMKTSFLTPKTSKPALPYHFEVMTTTPATTPYPKGVEGPEKDDEKEQEEEEEEEDGGNSVSDEDVQEGKVEEEEDDEEETDDNQESKESGDENSGSNETEEQDVGGEQNQVMQENEATAENNDQESEESSEEEEKSKEDNVHPEGPAPPPPADDKQGDNDNDDKMYHDYDHGWGWKKGHHHKKAHHAKGYSAEFHYETPGQYYEHHDGHGHHGDHGPHGGHPFYRSGNVEDDEQELFSMENPSFQKKVDPEMPKETLSELFSIQNLPLQKGDPETLRDTPNDDDHGWGWKKKKHHKKHHHHGWKKKKHHHHGWKKKKHHHHGWKKKKHHHHGWKKKHHHHHHNKFKNGWSQQYHYVATEDDGSHYYEFPSIKELIYSYMPSLTLDIADFKKRSVDAGKSARHLNSDNNKNINTAAYLFGKSMRKKVMEIINEIPKVKGKDVKQNNQAGRSLNEKLPNVVPTKTNSTNEQNKHKVEATGQTTNRMGRAMSQQTLGVNTLLLQFAVETGKKYYNPDECDKIFRICPWKHNQVLQIIEDSSVFAKGDGLQQQPKFMAMGGQPKGIGSALLALTQNLIKNGAHYEMKPTGSPSSPQINLMVQQKGAASVTNNNQVMELPKVKLHYNTFVMREVPVLGDEYYNTTTLPNVMDSYKAASVLGVKIKPKKVVHYKSPHLSHRGGFLHNTEKPAMNPRVPSIPKRTTTKAPIEKGSTTKRTEIAKPPIRNHARNTTSTSKRPTTKKTKKHKNKIPANTAIQKSPGNKENSVVHKTNNLVVEASEESIVIRIPKIKKAVKEKMADDYGSHFNRVTPYGTGNHHHNTHSQYQHSHSHHAPPKAEVPYWKKAPDQYQHYPVSPGELIPPG